MSAATTLPPDTETIEDRLREKLKLVKRNSLGSEYVAFRATRSEVLALAESELANAFRRVVLDPVRGLVMLMSPSGSHETISDEIEDFVVSVSLWKGIKTRKMRSSRWRRKTDPKNTGNEADCSFYFGQKAIDYGKAFSDSYSAADAYLERVPADLVVEVAVTHESREKQLSYRDKGVREFWQVDVRSDTPNRKVTVVFMDLQADRGPHVLDESFNLPDIRPMHVSIAVGLFRHRNLFDYDDRRKAVHALLERGEEVQELRQQQ